MQKLKHYISYNYKLKILIIGIAFLSSCATLKNDNRNFDKLISPRKLKADLNYTQRKLTKLHPHLYDYISKAELNYKFDSLKKTINQPLTKTELFYKLSPIVASIKQGHTRLFPPVKKLKTEEQNYALVNGYSTLSDFKFGIFDNRIYIIKNQKCIDSTIKIGTEIISINNHLTSDIITKYKTTFGSDGTNSTFHNRMIESYFDKVAYIQLGKQDSLQLQLKYNDSVFNRTIKREFDLTHFKKKPKIKQEKTQSYLTYPNNDSCTALLTIKGFEKENFKNIFDIIEYTNSDNLIIDLRGNLGGNLKLSNKLYSYLIPEKHRFIDSIEMNSRFAILHTNAFRNKKISGKLLHILCLPTVILYNLFFVTTKMETKKGKYFYKIKYNFAIPKSNNFKGTIFVITNGTTFSAGSVEASILKETKRAIIVGEETGGSAIGTVAGRLPNFKLPHSNLTLSFGLMYIEQFKNNINQGKGGVIPDVKITPTLTDRINHIDPELQWILDEIYGKHEFLKE